MNLIRFIVIALIIYLVIQIFKRWAANKESPKPSLQEKEMVRCHICQLHIPADEALEKEGLFYCSQEQIQHKSCEKKTANLFRFLVPVGFHASHYISAA